MTIASAEKEITELINEHAVYAAEVLINCIARAGQNHPYISCSVLHGLVECAYDRLAKEMEEEND